MAKSEASAASLERESRHADVPAITTGESRSGESVLERIGNTPLLRLERAGREFPHVEFYAKAEWFNPGGTRERRFARWENDR